MKHKLNHSGKIIIVHSESILCNITQHSSKEVEDAPIFNFWIDKRFC